MTVSLSSAGRSWLPVFVLARHIYPIGINSAYWTQANRCKARRQQPMCISSSVADLVPALEDTCCHPGHQIPVGSVKVSRVRDAASRATDTCAVYLGRNQEVIISKWTKEMRSDCWHVSRVATCSKAPLPLSWRHLRLGTHYRYYYNCITVSCSSSIYNHYHYNHCYQYTHMLSITRLMNKASIHRCMALNNCLLLWASNGSYVYLTKS